MVKFKSKDPFAEREAQKYERPIPSREFILTFLSERGSPATLQQLQSELALDDPDSQEALRRRLIAMCRDGQLLKNRKGAYGPIKNMELISGRVVGHKDGFGFLVPDEGGSDYFLSPRQMRMVFHGDRVLARIANGGPRGKTEANIVEVLEHNTQQVVGRFYTDSGVSYVEPSMQRFTQDILIPPGESKDAQHGQIVVASITSQPTLFSRPLGKIVEVLGDHMAPGMEITIAIRSHNLPYIFSEDTLSEASSFKAEVQEEEKAGRVDLRHLPFVTIDGEDAKDFDDAVYCEPKEKGGFTLYVAIADVSHYVKPGTLLDQEAYQRGNSVYFPGRVIPMLPEILSNNLCSLLPNVDRLAMVCEMKIHPTGRIMRYEFYEAVFQSKARLTYKEVHAMMEKNDRRARKKYDETIINNLVQLYDLFKTLHKARTARGAIDFDMPETKIIFDRNRKIKEIVPYERFTSHRVIEEAMLSANISAAKFLEKNKHPALYRVHEGPTEEKLTDLRRFLNQMALKMPGHRLPVPSDYAHVLRVVEDRPDAHMIQTVLLRSMSQAVYSPHNKGHFGLAYDAYTHFTSPIRRYPDLTVHRAIKEVLAKKKIVESEGKLVQTGEHCSRTERRADEATNEATDWLKCEYMLDKVGKEYDGVISGVTNFGIFVELNEVFVEGLVHISTLPDDYYHFDSIQHSLTGEHANRKFQLGNKVKVIVANVSLDDKKIDFVLKDSLQQKQGKKGKLKNVGRAKSQNAAPREKKNKKNKEKRKRQ